MREAIDGPRAAQAGKASGSKKEAEFRAWWRYRFSWYPLELVELAVEGEIERRKSAKPVEVSPGVFVENFWQVGGAEDLPPEVVQAYEGWSYEPYFKVTDATSI